jgi:hypothetical protein
LPAVAGGILAARFAPFARPGWKPDDTAGWEVRRYAGRKCRHRRLKLRFVPPHPRTTLACETGVAIVRFMSAIAEPDHVRAAHEQQVAIYRAMTPQQRLEQAGRMNRTMRELMAAAFRDCHPTWTEPQVRCLGGTG